MARRGIWALLALVAAAALSAAAGCGNDSSSPSASEAPAEQAAGGGRTEAIAELVARMPLQRKIAQMMLVGFEGTDDDGPVFDALGERGYGGLVVDAGNYVDRDQLEGLVDAALAEARGEDQLTPWVMAPQEGGQFNAFADLPPEEPPSGIRSAREAGEQARETAEALLDVGLTGILAPVVDVAPLAGGAIGPRAFSDIAEEVRGYAAATVEAFQRAGIFSAAKHFPGLGAASQSTEIGPANVGLTLDQLAERDLLPFEAAIEAQVPGIVVGHGLYAVEDFVTPASMSETIVTDLLRGDLGFDGVAIADDLTAPAITAAFRPQAVAVDAVRAGMDMVYVSTEEDEQNAVYDSLLGALRKGTISRDRVDQAVERILLAKLRSGVLELGADRRGGRGDAEADADAGGGEGGEGAPLRRDESRAFPG